MGLQSTVGYPAVAFPGQQVAFNQEAYTAENYVSDGTCKAGFFAFPKTVTASNGEIIVNTASLTAASGSPLGLVEKEFSASVGATNQDVYPAGATLSIAIRGDYWIKAGATAAVGKKVIVTLATGAISFADSASTGEVDSGWTVTKGGSSGDMIIISNHG